MIKKGTLFALAILLSACGSDDEPSQRVPDSTLQTESSSTEKIADDHWSAYTDVVIDAPADEVWRVLTDWDQLEDWSSSFHGLTGDIRDGGSVNARYLNNGQVVDIPHTLIYEDGVKFGWSDPTGPADLVPFGGFVDEHIFEVVPISDCQSRFIQRDAFMGEGNAMFDAEGLAEFIVPFYQGFNTELKAEVEEMQ